MFDLAFNETLIPLDQPDTHEKIQRISPSGRVPCLMMDETPVWESLAICETLHDLFPDKHLWPQDFSKRAHARAISNEMHAGFTALRQTCPMNVKARHLDMDISPAHKDIARIVELWSTCLQRYGHEGAYLMGSPSIADCMYAPVVFRFRTYGVTLPQACQRYVEHMLNHPAMREWEASALAETFVMTRYERNAQL